MKQMISSCHAVVLVLFLFVRPSLGQGTFGMFPDPITHSELMEYADLLGLSADQRTALQDPHNLYLASMRDLRANQIDVAMTDMLQFAGTVPDTEQFDDFQLQQRKIIRQIAQRDNEFFDSIIDLVTDEQLVSMNRVRYRRERKRLDSVLNGVNEVMPISRVDLSSLLIKVPMSNAERLVIAPILSEYDEKITLHYRRLWLISQESSKAMVTALSAVNLPGANGRSSKKEFEEFLLAFRTSAQTIDEEFRDDFSRLNELNESVVRRIQELITVETGTKLKLLYLNAAHYGVIGSELAVYEELLAALAMEDLDSEMNEKLTELGDQFLAKSDIAIERMVRIDKKAGVRSRFDWYDWEEASEDEIRLNKLRALQDEYNQDVRDELKTVLGDRWDDYKKIKIKRRTKTRQERSVVKGTIVVVEEHGQSRIVAYDGNEIGPSDSAHLDDAFQAESPTGDYGNVDPPQDKQRSNGGFSLTDIAAVVPQPISREDVGRLINNLDLNGVRRELVQGLYSDYHDNFNSYRNTNVMPLGGRLIGIGIALRAGRVPSEEELRRLFKDVRQAFDGMVLVDQTFFDNVAIVLGVESTYFPLRQARLRRGVSLYLNKKLSDGLRTNGMGFGGSAEFTVNLADVLTELELSEDERSRLEGPLLAYHEEMELTTTNAWNSLLDSIIELLVLARRVYVENIGSMDQEPDPMMMASVFFENQNELGRLFDSGIAALKSMSEVNIRHVDEIAKLLSPEQQERFVDLYKRTAFPHIYERRENAMRVKIAQSQLLKSITPNQISQIGGLLAEYNAIDSKIGDQLVALNRVGAPVPLGGILGATGSNEGIQGFMAYEQNRQQLMFDRNTLEERSRDRLLKILTSAQKQQLYLTE